MLSHEQNEVMSSKLMEQHNGMIVWHIYCVNYVIYLFCYIVLMMSYLFGHMVLMTSYLFYYMH